MSPDTPVALVPRRLVVIRHAKSSWKHPALTDHQRPLNRRGKRTAPAVAQWLIDRNWRPDGVILSDATRALSTWKRMAEHLDPTVPTWPSRDLYHGGLAAWVQALAQLDTPLRTVWIIGHNPGLEVLCGALANHHQPIKTADAVLLTGWGANWAEATAGAWRVHTHLTARTVDPAT